MQWDQDLIQEVINREKVRFKKDGREIEVNEVCMDIQEASNINGSVTLSLKIVSPNDFLKFKLETIYCRYYFDINDCSFTLVGVNKNQSDQLITFKNNYMVQYLIYHIISQSLTEFYTYSYYRAEKSAQYSISISRRDSASNIKFILEGMDESSRIALTKMRVFLRSLITLLDYLKKEVLNLYNQNPEG